MSAMASEVQRLAEAADLMPKCPHCRTSMDPAPRPGQDEGTQITRWVCSLCEPRSARIMDPRDWPPTGGRRASILDGPDGRSPLQDLVFEEVKMGPGEQNTLRPRDGETLGRAAMRLARLVEEAPDERLSDPKFKPIEQKAHRPLAGAELLERLKQGLQPAGPYAKLELVLDRALEQASGGKGKERHANEGEPFERQQICEITRRLGHGFARGQAVKKIYEAQRLPRDRAVAELLGAVNYIAASIIVLEEEGE